MRKGVPVCLMKATVQQTQFLLSRFASVVNVLVPLEIARDGHTKVLRFLNTGIQGGVNQERDTGLDLFSGDN